MSMPWQSFQGNAQAAPSHKKRHSLWKDDQAVTNLFLSLTEGWTSESAYKTRSWDAYRMSGVTAIILDQAIMAFFVQLQAFYVYDVT